MNYYGPRELTDEDGERTGTYHYTKKRKKRIWPLGYCAGTPVTTQEEWDEKMGANSPSEQYEHGWDDPRADRDKRSLRVNEQKIEEHGDKFHDHGHETEEEAVECYTEYCLDFKLTFWHEDDTELKENLGVSPHGLSEPLEDDDVPADEQGRECPYDGCDTIVARPTAIIGSVGMPERLHLCSEHANRGSVEEFWSAPSEAFGSH